MDIENLIERLKQKDGLWCSVPTGENLIADAATALSTLQANLEEMTQRNDENLGMCRIWERRYSELQAENEKLRETVDKYATAARVIALHLKPFCDESLPYDEMIADAARKASDELEQVERLYESEKEDFIDFACSGVLNLSPYCLNRNPDCVDERGWCRTEKCRGFSRERSQKED